MVGMTLAVVLIVLMAVVVVVMAIVALVMAVVVAVIVVVVGSPLRAQSRHERIGQLGDDDG